MKVLYKIFSAALLVVSLIGAYYDNVTFATIAFLSSVLLFIFSSIENVEEFSAGLQGIKAKFKEVQNAIDEVRKVAKTMAKISLNLLIKSDYLFGASTKIEKENYRKEIVALLNKLKLSNDDILEATEVWYKITLHQHAYALLSGSRPLPNLSEFKDERDGLLEKSWKSGLQPSEVKDFLVKVGKFDELSDFYSDYEYFFINREFKRLEVWNDHENWDLLAKIPSEKSS